MSREAASHLRVDSNIRAERVYPVDGSKRSIEDLKTVALRLTKDQAIHLATTLLVAARNWDIIDVTAFRKNRRKSDGTHIVTVTSRNPSHDADSSVDAPKA